MSDSNKACNSNIPANPNDILFAALTIALAVSSGRSRYEVETLINLSSLVTNNLQTILRQMIINDNNVDNLDINI